MERRGTAGVGGVFALTLLSACQDTRVQTPPLSGADVGRGKAVVERVACGACHVIPGVSWPKGRVGPSLEGFAEQSLIAGQFPNRAEVLAQWVRDAPSMAPATGMPPTPITESEARDVAAFLLTLRAR